MALIFVVHMAFYVLLPLALKSRLPLGLTHYLKNKFLKNGSSIYVHGKKVFMPCFIIKKHSICLVS